MIVYHFLNDPNTNRIDDIEALLFELTKRVIKITREQFLLIAMRSRWLAALEERSEKIIGMATLVPVNVPTGLSGRIEDVVFLPDYQGDGHGREIISRLIEEGRRMGMRRLTLASKPERGAANNLYFKLGFIRDDTDNYRLVL